MTLCVASLSDARACLMEKDMRKTSGARRRCINYLDIEKLSEQDEGESSSKVSNIVRMTIFLNQLIEIGRRDGVLGYEISGKLYAHHIVYECLSLY